MSEVLFVGREQEIDDYEQFLAQETPWVMIITGLGGIGKSTLLHRLAEYTLANPSQPTSGVVKLDFANEDLRNDPLKLLDKLTQDILTYCNVQRVDVELKKALQQNFDQLAQLSKERVQTGFKETEDPVLREVWHQMRELATEALYLWLKTLSVTRLVIMLDTCEWLTEPEGVEIGQWILNELVPGIHNRIKRQKQQCLIVIASRVQLNLDAINRREQQRLALSMLDKAAVDGYLQQMGMQDPDLRQRVYEVTRGHALCVSIIGYFWKNSNEQTQPFTIVDLPELEQQVQKFSEIALMSFTNERVLKQLRSPFLELTQYGVLLRSFNLPLLRAVFPELLPEEESLERFNHLIRYPFIEARGNYRYVFHELLREALAEETQKEAPEQWKQYHKRAFEHFTKISPQSPDCYYHLLAFNEAQGLAAWQEAIRDARSTGKPEFIGALLQAALDKALKLSSAARGEIAYEQGRFNHYDAQLGEALKSYSEALVLFKQVEDYGGQAKTLQVIGDVQRARDKLDEALASYDKALIFFQRVGDKSGEARCYQASGDIRRLNIKLEDALQSYEKSLGLFRQINDKPEEAKVLEAVGEIQKLRNELDAALRSYEQALALYQGEQDRLKRAGVLIAIGDVQKLRNDKNAALENYEQALAIFGELKEPKEEAKIRRAIEEMHRPQSELALAPSLVPMGGDSNAFRTILRELSPVLAPIPFAIVIFLFSLLANARGIYYLTLLPLGLILLALVVIQGTCLYYAGNQQTPWMLSLIGGYVVFVLVGAYVFFGLGGSLLTLVLLVILALIFGRRFTRQVPVGNVDVVVTPRGRSHTLTPGFNLLYPWEKVLVRLPTKEITWTTPPVHVSISRDQEADIVADITYQLAEDVADIAVLHLANWEEDLHRHFLSILKSIINDIPPDEILSWAHHMHDQSPISDDPANPLVETRWDRLNKQLLLRLQNEMAQRGIQVNMVHVQDITVLSHYAFANTQTRPVEIGAVRGLQLQQLPQPYILSSPPSSAVLAIPTPPTLIQTNNVPPSSTVQTQGAHSPRIVLPSSNRDLSTVPGRSSIQGMIDSYKAVNEQLINDPNFIMELATRFKAIADNPEANAQFPVDAEKASYNLIRRANLILASEERHHHSGPVLVPTTVERKVYRIPNPPNENLAYGG